MHDPIALAVPLFFVLIGLEMVWARARGVRVYRFADALTDLSCGITSQITLLIWAATQLAMYSWLYEHHRLFTFERAWVPWVIAFFAVDFVYYWWHRLSHEVNFLWAAHVVHHQSEDYNLAVALRQSVLTSWTTLPFYLPIAFLGVRPVVFATVLAASTLYQFWIHTELVGKLRGPLDWIMNLPSHHRVHHAINTKYLDKNYAATLIVWDRLFGTYEEEIEKPVFGITKPLASFDPMWAQVHYWLEMGAMCRAAKRPFDKVRVWFTSPAWKPQGFVPADVPPIDTRAKYDRKVSPRMIAWVAANFVVVVAATFCIMMWHGVMPRVPLVLASLAVLGSLVAFGALLEGRTWGRSAEVLRIAIGAAAVVSLVPLSCREKKREPTVVPVQGESAILPRVTPPSGATKAATLVVDGRRVVLVEPVRPVADAKKLPLVIAFHGDGGDAEELHNDWPFERGTGDAAFIAYADARHPGSWDLETVIGNIDIAYVVTLIDTLATRLPIDRTRVFLTGYSNGGFFANVFACHKPDLVRAIASNAGGAPYNQPEKWPNGFPKCPGQKPVAAMALHGRRDFGVTLDSGRFSAEYWASVNGCNGAELESTGYELCSAYRGCPAGKAVVWCEIPDLGHWVWDHAAEASWTFFQTQSATLQPER